MSPPFFILTLFSLTLLQPSPTSGTRSILQDLDGDVAYAVDVDGTNFDKVFSETQATYAIVEFFAQWCPVCQSYRPQYEKVARLFNGPGAVHPGIVLMTRVDCAMKSFRTRSLSALQNVNAAGSYDPRLEKRDFLVIHDFKPADHLLTWINQQLGSSYILDDQKFGNVQSDISVFTQITRAVSDIEEATTTAFDIILQQKMIKSETRVSLIKYIQLLVVHHPSRRCRRGSAEILVNFDDLYPPDMISHSKQEDLDIGGKKGALENIQICGKEVPRGYWMFCRGSRNDTRGFSCGLWVLFHSLSVRIEDRESQNTFTAICDFIHNFFICEECRQHFYGMCSSVSTPFSKARDYALWLWSAHNEVNARLMKEEASLGTGDPKFPKIAWPPRQLCSSCHQNSNNGSSQIDWNREEVFKFLVSYYGKTLVSLDKDLVENEKNSTFVEDLAIVTAPASTNAVVVPVGAALAIALASCGFGTLACYWRAKQKNRKPRRSWN